MADGGTPGQSLRAPRYWQCFRVDGSSARGSMAASTLVKHATPPQPHVAPRGKHPGGRAKTPIIPRVVAAIGDAIRMPVKDPIETARSYASSTYGSRHIAMTRTTGAPRAKLAVSQIIRARCNQPRAERWLASGRAARTKLKRQINYSRLNRSIELVNRSAMGVSSSGISGRTQPRRRRNRAGLRHGFGGIHLTAACAGIQQLCPPHLK